MTSSHPARQGCRLSPFAIAILICIAFWSALLGSLHLARQTAGSGVANIPDRPPLGAEATAGADLP